MPNHIDQSPPFASWLLAQRLREGWIGDLSRAAARDRSFPRRGDPFEVLDRVRAVMIDGDYAQAVDAAATEWFGDHRWRRHFKTAAEKIRAPRALAVKAPRRRAPKVA